MSREFSGTSPGQLKKCFFEVDFDALKRGGARLSSAEVQPRHAVRRRRDGLGCSRGRVAAAVAAVAAARRHLPQQAAEVQPGRRGRRPHPRGDRRGARRACPAAAAAAAAQLTTAARSGQSLNTPYIYTSYGIAS